MREGSPIGPYWNIVKPLRWQSLEYQPLERRFSPYPKEIESSLSFQWNLSIGRNRSIWIQDYARNINISPPGDTRLDQPPLLLNFQYTPYTSIKESISELLVKSECRPHTRAMGDSKLFHLRLLERIDGFFQLFGS